VFLPVGTPLFCLARRLVSQKIGAMAGTIAPGIEERSENSIKKTLEEQVGCAQGQDLVIGR